MGTVTSHTIVTLDGAAVFDSVADTIVELRDTPEVLDDFFARDSVPKFVVSRSLDAAPWGTHDPATVLAGDLTEQITQLKRGSGGTIGVHGSPTLVDGLLQADLIDELRLEVYPVVAGTGARLFKEGGAPKRLRLAESRTTRNGVVILSYRRPG